MLSELTWDFPLPRTHTGIPLANAVTGLLIWGEGRNLRITVSRADFWDHRGGMDWSPKQNFADIRSRLEANDEPGLRELFKTDTEDIPGQPARPSVLPVGRIDLELTEGSVLKSGKINFADGKVIVAYERDGQDFEAVIELAMEEQLFYVGLAEDEDCGIKCVTSWDYIGDYLKSISFDAPEYIDSVNVKGWIQVCPVDPALCVCCRKDGNAIYAMTERSDDPVQLEKDVVAELENAASAGIARITGANSVWWGNYWKDIPEISVPHAELEELYTLGLFKFAGLTNPVGIAGTLQGPWIEEYRMPPWSSDYHFNINVQMCYWPAYKANRPEHLKPIFDLVWSWREQLAKNAKMFVGIDDGFMLPHAVDDHCTCMGSFWTGTIDHACAAWIAQMMFQYVQYTNDLEFLKEVAFPFMKGTMRVFEEMMEKDADAKYSLPVSVSPEYRGCDMDAWGKDASFQLAAIRSLAEFLNTAAVMLSETPAPIWQDILDNLPEYCTFGEGEDTRIALWEGTDLEESHRHHSHLGGICPFDTIDIYAEEHQDVILRSVTHWIETGSGKWTGWCMPWASMLHSRLNNGGMAVMLLEILKRVFINEGNGTLHDFNFPGYTVMGGSLKLKENPGEVQLEPDRTTVDVMQLDAGMGAVTAVQDILMHSRRGTVYLFPGIPKAWKNVSFTEMPCEGGFLISAEIANSSLLPITISSRFGGVLKLGNPWGTKAVKVVIDGVESSQSGKVLELDIPSGATCWLNVE